MKQPIVLHVCAVEYSARTLLVPQLDFLADRGYDVRLACAPEKGVFGSELDRFRPIPVEFPRNVHLLRMLQAARSFAATVRRLQPDVIHLHSSAAASVVRLIPRRAFGDRPPHVIFTVHGYPFLWTDLARPSGRVLELIERALARRTDLMLFQSMEDFDESTRRSYRSKLRYLGNGVQEEWFSVPSRPPHDGPLRLVFIGRLIRDKGILELVEAVARVPSVELVVAGGRLASERDDVMPALERLVADKRVEGRVTLLGSVDPADMRDVVAGADVFVLPTACAEGVPRSIIEAMAAGRPVITTPIRGGRELVNEDVEGWFSPPRDATALAAVISRVAALPRDRLVAVGAAGRKRARADHAEQDVLERLLASYVELGVTGTT